jgi:hypothetical protein
MWRIQGWCNAIQCLAQAEKVPIFLEHGFANNMACLVQKFIIHGLTTEGKVFRPSDWAERLAGVMSQFRPAGSFGGPLTYSPYVLPLYLDGVRCVVVDYRLRELEPLAWKFVCDFAESNDLKTSDQMDTDPPRS